MDELVAFARAQLDARERVALAAEKGAGRHWRTGIGMDEARIESAGMTIYDEGGHGPDQAKHIALNDPASVLADIAAKRAILEWAVRAIQVTEADCYQLGVEDVVRLLAQPYAGQDGWRAEC